MVRSGMNTCCCRTGKVSLEPVCFRSGPSALVMHDNWWFTENVTKSQITQTIIIWMIFWWLNNWFALDLFPSPPSSRLINESLLAEMQLSRCSCFSFRSFFCSVVDGVEFVSGWHINTRPDAEILMNVRLDSDRLWGSKTVSGFEFLTNPETIKHRQALPHTWIFN